MTTLQLPPAAHRRDDVAPPVRRRSRVRLLAYVLLAVEIALAVVLLVAQVLAPGGPPTPGVQAFLHTQADGVAPVTWDPCSPIGYVVDWELAPPGSLQVWTEAVAIVEEATGLTFTGLGATAASPASTSQTPDTAAARGVVLHELGHLVGLDHVEDTGQLVSGENVGSREYQGGDLERGWGAGAVAGRTCT